MTSVPFLSVCLEKTSGLAWEKRREELTESEWLRDWSLAHLRTDVACQLLTEQAPGWQNPEWFSDFKDRYRCFSWVSLNVSFSRFPPLVSSLSLLIGFLLGVCFYCLSLIPGLRVFDSNNLLPNLPLWKQIWLNHQNFENRSGAMNAVVLLIGCLWLRVAMEEQFLLDWWYRWVAWLVLSQWLWLCGFLIFNFVFKCLFIEKWAWRSSPLAGKFFN